MFIICSHFCNKIVTQRGLTKPAAYNSQTAGRPLYHKMARVSIDKLHKISNYFLCNLHNCKTPRIVLSEGAFITLSACGGQGWKLVPIRWLHSLGALMFPASGAGYCLFPLGVLCGGSSNHFYQLLSLIYKLIIPQLVWSVKPFFIWGEDYSSKSSPTTSIV